MLWSLVTRRAAVSSLMTRGSSNPGVWWTRPSLNAACDSGLTAQIQEKVNRNLAGMFMGKVIDETVTIIKTKFMELNCFEKSSRTGMPSAGIALNQPWKSMLVLRWVQSRQVAGAMLWGRWAHCRWLIFANVGPLPCPPTAACYSCFPVRATVQGLQRHMRKGSCRESSPSPAHLPVPSHHPPESRVTI